MNDTFYQLSLNILKALGGDVTIVYPDADAIWDEINKIYNNAGNRFDIVPLEKTITENGEYEYYPDGDVDAFMPVNLTVKIPQKYTDEQVFEIEANAIQQGYDNGYSEGETAGKLIGREEGYTDGFNTGYSDGVTDGIENQKSKLVDITITENGVYTKDDGYKTVTVEVEAGIPEEELQQMLQEAMDEGYQDGYAEGVDDGREDGIAEQKEKLESTTITENGTYTREDGWNSVIVEVAGSGGGDSGKPKIYNGFRLLSTDSTLSSKQRFTTKLKEVDFTQYDWSGVYDLTEFFGGFKKDNSSGAGAFVDSDFDNFRAGYNGQMVSCSYMFKTAPGAGTNYTLKEIPDFSMFTDKLINMSAAFYGTELVLVDNITKWNTSNVVDMSDLFSGCSKLTSIPVFDTSSVVNMDGMFYGCIALKSVPQLDYSKAINIGRIFGSCTGLKEIPDLDISSATSFIGNVSSGWISNSTQISKIGVLQCDSITNVQYVFGGSNNNTKITDFGGCVNLGKVPGEISSINSDIAFTCAPNLTYQSVLNILNGLYDRASAGYSVLTLKLHNKHLAMLSDDDIAIATNKGWILV